MIIYNGKLITWDSDNRILDGAAILINDDKIARIASKETLFAEYPEEERVDAQGQLIMPGNICAHTHFYGAFARGMGIPGNPPRDFPEILKKLWWPLDMALDETAVRLSAQVMLIDAIRHGTTTLFDHHASPNFITGSLDVIAREIDQAGLRGVLCYEVTDRNGREGTLEGIEENKRFMQYVESNNPAGGRIKATFGLHASLTLSEETLDLVQDSLGSNTGVHIHVAEHQEDEFDSVQKYGKRVIDRLADHGLLGDNSIIVHGVHIDIGEAVKLYETGTWLTHQPRSNMNNAVGIAPIEDLLRLGVKVCIGTDGFSHTMWEEWKFAYLLPKFAAKDPRRMGGFQVIQMGVKNNAQIAKHFLGYPIGIIEEGAMADLIFVDYPAYTPITPDNLPWHILFGFNESMITATIASGRFVMRDRKVLTLDEDRILKEAEEYAPIVWEKYTKYVEERLYEDVG